MNAQLPWIAMATVLVAAVAVTACGNGPGASPNAPETTASGSVTPFVQVVGDLSESTGQPAGQPSQTPAGSDSNGAYVPESSIDTVDKRVQVTVNGKIVYIRNGGQVVLGDGLVAEIFVDPYPPSTLRTWADFFLTKDGEPVTDASMGIEYDMLSMVHGPWTGVAENLGGGHYLFKLDYIMFGAWDQTATIRNGLDRISIPFVLVAYP